jgi:hypothetical protein
MFGDSERAVTVGPEAYRLCEDVHVPRLQQTSMQRHSRSIVDSADAHGSGSGVCWSAARTRITLRLVRICAFCLPYLRTDSGRVAE